MKKCEFPGCTEEATKKITNAAVYGVYTAPHHRCDEHADQFLACALFPLHYLVEDILDTSFVGDCGVCGERYDVRSRFSSVADIGEFVSPSGTHITCHAECGLHMGLELA